MNINELFTMDSYGVYVWTAYCITFFIFGANFFAVWSEKRLVKKILRQFLTQANKTL